MVWHSDRRSQSLRNPAAFLASVSLAVAGATASVANPAAPRGALDIDLVAIIGPKPGLAAPEDLLAVQCYDCSSPSKPHNPGSGPKGRRLTFVNPYATTAITNAISSSLATCSPETMERRYRIDCIRYHFWKLSRDLPRTGEYAPVRRAMEKAAADLEALVRQNRDPAAPTLRPREKGLPLAPRLPPIRAVDRAAEEQVLRAAEAIIDEAATVLLRSTENSERRMAHFQQISTAIDSTKVLLRST